MLFGVAVTGLGGLVGILVPLWTVLAAAGLSIPNAPALALNRHGEAAGTAAAMLGAVQFGVGALAAPLVGALGGSGLGMAVVVVIGMFGALAVLLLVPAPHSRRRGRPLAPEGLLTMTFGAQNRRDRDANLMIAAVWGDGCQGAWKPAAVSTALPLSDRT